MTNPGRKNLLQTLLLSALCVLPERSSAAPAITLIVPSEPAQEQIDLTRYALGQGGLSDSPMFDPHVEQVRQLHPQTIRIFVQEYFDLYPAKGQYHWETLDRTIETILATGAKPILALCFKPKVLFPQVNHDVVHPLDYAEWEQLIFELVKHCNSARKFGIEYWEIGNEPDIGEDGGCPYRFKPADYVQYYDHTTAAILRADPAAKVGGPALAGFRSPIGDALIEHCGNGKAPLHFFSWHIYSNDVGLFRSSIKEIKAKLARYPSLKNTETILDEWNMSLGNPNLIPSFQPAFILEVTRVFQEEGLGRGAYYHIRDYFVDPKKFAWMSPNGIEFMAHWWNVMPQYDGLFDNQGRVRPAWFAFQLMSLIQGQKLEVSGSADPIRVFAAKNRSWHHVVFWNYPSGASKEKVDVTLQLPEKGRGQYRLMKLNAERAVNNLEVIRHGGMAELKTAPLRIELEPYGIAWVEATW